MESSVQRINDPSPRKRPEAIRDGGLSRPSSVSPFPSGIQVQAKLETTEAGDPLEREADSMADLAMRKIVAGSSGALPPPTAGPHLSVSAFGGTALTLPSRMESRLNASLGGGHALPGPLRSQMEGVFGQPFSQVRVHTDSSSAEMNQGIGARAFTYGSDIFFNQGQYDPSSAEGQRLIAHELTHVAQQSGKVARDVNHAALRGIIQSYFVDEWHWGQFYHYLYVSHSAVVRELELELDEGFFSVNWEKERGVPFLEEVSRGIVRDIKKKKKLDSWDSAYFYAISEFEQQRPLRKRALAPVFDALITITKNHKSFQSDANSLSYNELKKKTQSIPFSGKFFDNRNTVIGDLYSFLKKEYPGALSYEVEGFLWNSRYSIDGASDIKRNSEEFAEQMDKFLGEFISSRYRSYYERRYPEEKDKPYWERKNDNKETVRQFYESFEKELYGHLSTYGKCAKLLLDMVLCNQETLYSNDFYLPDAFVSAEAWTDLFFDIMIQGGSLLIGGPLISGILAKVVLKSPVAKWVIEQTAQAAFDFVTGAGEEALRQKRHGEEFDPNEVLKAAGISVVMGKVVEGGMGTISGVGKYMKGGLRGVDDAVEGVVEEAAENAGRSVAKDAAGEVVEGSVENAGRGAAKDVAEGTAEKAAAENAAEKAAAEKAAAEKAAAEKAAAEKAAAEKAAAEKAAAEKAAAEKAAAEKAAAEKAAAEKAAAEKAAAESAARGASDAVPSQHALPSPEMEQPLKMDLGEPKLEPVPVRAQEPAYQRTVHEDVSAPAVHEYSDVSRQAEVSQPKVNGQSTTAQSAPPQVPESGHVKWEKTKSFLDSVYSIDFKIVNAIWKRSHGGKDMGKRAKLVFNLFKSGYASYPIIKYLFEDKKSDKDRNDAIISTTGGLVSVWLPSWTSLFITLFADTGKMVNSYAYSDELDFPDVLLGMLKSQGVGTIPFSYTFPIFQDGWDLVHEAADWLSSQEPELRKEVGFPRKERQEDGQSEVSESSPESSPEEGSSPAWGDLGHAVRDRWIDTLRDLNDQVIKQAKTISRRKTETDSTEVSLDDLLSSIEFVTFLSLGEWGREKSLSSAHSFDELYALSMKMKARSEQQELNPALRKKYLLVAAYLYGLASYVASDDCKRAVKERVERWEKRAETM